MLHQFRFLDKRAERHHAGQSIVADLLRHFRRRHGNNVDVVPLRRRPLDERLVQDPSGVMRTVCQFLDVPYDPVVVTPTVLGAAYLGNSRFDSALHGVSAAAVGRYRDVLSASQLERAEALLAQVLSAGGYAPTLQTPGGRHPVAEAAITVIIRSRLWRLRALRALFRRA